MPPTKKQLVVFDFDWSMADQDSDRWVMEVLAPDLRRKMEDRSKTGAQWTDIVADCLRELAQKDRHVRRQDIETTLRQMPFHPAMKRGIQHLKDPKIQSHTGVEMTLAVLSNANTFFIGTILEHQGLRDHFESITTNPATFSTENPDYLVLRRRVGPEDPAHGCQIGCEENMCKGQELVRYLAQRDPFDRVIYVGDGNNDFCPVLRLGRQDIVLCRHTRAGLERKIADELARGKDSRLKCTVVYWSGAWEVEEKFGEYAQRTSFGDLN